MMKREINKYIKQVIFSKKIYKIIYISLMLGVFLIVGITSSLFSVKKDKQILNAKKLYGEYQYSLSYISKDCIDSIIKEDCVKTDVPYVFEFNRHFGGEYNTYEIYTTKEYIDFSNTKLIAGKFPETSNEILCESKFLSLFNEEWSDEREIYISYKNEKYKISGILRCNKYDELVQQGAYCPNIIFNLEQNLDYLNALVEENDQVNELLYSVILESKTTNYVDDVEYLKNKYDLQDSQILYNYNVLEYAQIDEYGNDKLPWDVIMKYGIYMVYIMLIYISIKIMKIIFEKNRYDYNVLKSIGIEGNVINKCLLKTIVFYLVLTVTSSILISLIIKKFMIDGYRIELFSKLGEFITLNIIVALVYVVMFICMFEIKGNIANELNNKDRISKKIIDNKKFYIKRKFVSNIANNTFAVRKKYFISYVILIVLSMLTINCFSYMIDCFVNENDKNQYDYRVDYVYFDESDFMFGSSEIQQCYENVKANSDKYKTVGVFYDVADVETDKDILSGDYKSYLLETNKKFEKILESKYVTKYTDRVLVVGIDMENIDDICDTNLSGKLKDDECYILKNVYNFKDKKDCNTEWGIKEGSVIKFTYYEYGNDSKINDEIDLEENNVTKDEEIKVLGVIDDIKISINQDVKCPVVFVNMNTFYKISWHDYPDKLYVNAINGNYEEVQNEFEQYFCMDLVDLREEQNMAKKEKFSAFFSVYVVGVILGILLIINLIIVNKESFDINKSQLAMLMVMGVDRKTVWKIQSYIYIKMIFISILIGNILSLVASYKIADMIKEQEETFIFRIPFGIFANTSLMICIILASQMIYLRVKVYKLKIQEVLVKE